MLTSGLQSILGFLIQGRYYVYYIDTRYFENSIRILQLSAFVVNTKRILKRITYILFSARPFELVVTSPNFLSISPDRAVINLNQG